MFYVYSLHVLSSHLLGSPLKSHPSPASFPRNFPAGYFFWLEKNTFLITFTLTELLYLVHCVLTFANPTIHILRSGQHFHLLSTNLLLRHFKQDPVLLMNKLTTPWEQNRPPLRQCVGSYCKAFSKHLLKQTGLYRDVQAGPPFSFKPGIGCTNYFPSIFRLLSLFKNKCVWWL